MYRRRMRLISSSVYDFRLYNEDALEPEKFIKFKFYVIPFLFLAILAPDFARYEALRWAEVAEEHL